MKPYREMSKEELASLKEQLTAVYKEYQGKNLSLNMARGKPSQMCIRDSPEPGGILWDVSPAGSPAGYW